jgi:heme/copper-type cytochrome/quinol oxidase subunit 3
MYFFVGSESFFFLALIISYIYFSRTNGVLSDSAKYLDIKRTGIFTIALLTSSLTIYMADVSLKRLNRKALKIWLMSTMFLGLLFLLGQITEYIRLYKVNVTISKNVFGSAFFTLTGFHGLHVLIGLIVLSVVLIMLLTGRFKAIENTALTTASIYWHFVDAVWIVVFSVVYLGAIL